jgi:cytochrome c5
MKRSLLSVAGICCLLHFGGCQNADLRPPPKAADLAVTGKRQHVDVAVLSQGRNVFVSRCTECHTLPAISRHTPAAWPGLVDSMSGRARLKSAEHDALIAYILAARAQP